MNHVPATTPREYGVRALFVIFAMLVSIVGPFAPSRALADGTPGDRASQTTVVRTNPATGIPFVEGAIKTNYVSGIAEVGNTVVVVGKFPSVRNPGSSTSISRTNIFAYDKTTGLVNSTFVPAVNGTIDTVAIAPDGQSVFIVGNFSTVNGQASYGLAKLTVSNGQMAPGWTTSTEGRVRDAKVVGNQLFLGGDFWRVGGVTRDRLAVVNATTGAVESFNVPITVPRVGTHAWVASIGVSADGSQIVAVGNFLEVAGQSRAQIALIDANTSSVSGWSTQAYAANCNLNAFWTYMRDIEFSPDAGYFVTATTGGPYLGTHCDTAARWENQPTANSSATWVDWSGGDTLTAVAITNATVYIGGHQRWMNNHLGADQAKEGAVDRSGLTALDPLNGVPFKWNPGRDRGATVHSLHVTTQGLYLGGDTDVVNFQQKGKLAYFPLAGGTSVPVPTPVTLPVTMFETRSDGTLTSAGYDGTVAGPPVTVPNTGVTWSTVLGATVEAGNLYYTKSDNRLYSRTFDGTTFGAETDLVTGTYVGTSPSLTGVLSMTWDKGRLYYTRSGQSSLFYRYLSLESGIIGSQTFTIASQPTGFQPSGTTGMEVIGNHLYYTRTDNILRRVQWVNGGPVAGTVETLSGPGIDGRTWNGKDFFARAAIVANVPPTVSVTAPTNGATVSGAAVVLTANAADSDGTVTKVDFKIDGTIVGTDTSSAGGWTFNWNSTTSTNGAHTVTATATDNSNAPTTSTAVNVTVNNVIPNVPPTVSVTAPTNGATVSGAAVVLTANAADSDGTVTKVDFKIDGTIVGTDTSSAGGWTFNWNSTTSTNGAHTVTATATDNSNAPTTSTAVNVTVNNGGTTGPAQILFVVGNPAGLTNGDVAVRNQLLSKGHVVTIVDDNSAQVSDSNGKSLLLLSSSIDSNVLGATFAAVGVPILVAKPYSLDDYGLTAAPASNYGSKSLSAITIVDPAHATAAGFTGNVAFRAGNTTYTWGTATPSAKVVATAGTDPTIFNVEPGASLATGVPAPACRLTFPIFNDMPATYNTSAWTMFHASIDWGIANCTSGGTPTDTPPTASVTAPTNGAVVSGASVALSATASDDLGVGQVQFKVDGTVVATDTNGGDGWSGSWDSTTAANGAHVVTATATDTIGQTGSSTNVNITVANGGDPNPPIGDEASRVVVISVDALTSASIGTLGSTGAPSIYKIITEGATTLNARAMFEQTQTLPNHSSMFTGRQIALPGGHGVTFNEDNGLTIHQSAGGYVQSMFDVIHDAGGSTTLYTGKSKFDFYDRSWNGSNGASDTVGTDDGKDKVDSYAVQGGSTATSSLIAQLNSSPASLSVIHFAATDGAGHEFGFGSPQYLAAVTEVDGYVGQILAAIEANPALEDSTVVILTSDHGGNINDHADPTLATNYTIPFLVWGTPIPSGDLYTMNAVSRTAPGTGRPNYTDPDPVRNADTANLVTDLLGLPSLAGSSINDDQSLKFAAVAPDNAPTVSITAPSQGATVSGASVTVSANASDDHGVTKVEFKVDGVLVGTDTDGSNGWSVNWDSTTASDAGHVISAVATDTIAQTGTSANINVTVSNATGGPAQIVFVVGNPAGLTAGDVAVRDQLLSQGHVVNLVDDNAAAASDANGKSLIVISSSINTNVFGPIFANVAVPVLVAKPYALDDYGLTAAPASNYGNRSTATITIVDPSHPAAAGFSGSVAFKGGLTNVTWGTATASAKVIATVGTDPTIFSVEPGSLLANGTTAAACRLTFPIFNNEPASYNATAWAMFHASINWGIANCGGGGGGGAAAGFFLELTPDVVTAKPTL